MRTLAICLVACVVGLQTGCEQQTALIPVTGTVQINGKPAAAIMVQVMPSTTDVNKAAPTSQALSDENGEFVLVTLDNRDGGVEGPCRITLFDTLETRKAQGSRGGTNSRLHPKFSSKGIQQNVEEGVPLVLKATGP